MAGYEPGALILSFFFSPASGLYIDLQLCNIFTPAVLLCFCVRYTMSFLPFLVLKGFPVVNITRGSRKGIARALDEGSFVQISEFYFHI